MTRRWLTVLLVTLALMATVMAAVGVARREAPRGVRASTFNAGPPGLRALYEALRAADAPVRRWHRPYAQLPADAGLLIVAAPVRPFTRAEWEQHIVPWLTEGRTLILASAVGDPIPLRRTDELTLQQHLRYGKSRYEADLRAELEEGPEEPAPVDRGEDVEFGDVLDELSRLQSDEVKRIQVTAVQDTAFTPQSAPLDVPEFTPVFCHDAHAVPLYLGGHEPYAWHIPMHEGHVILTATSAWLTNADVARGQNLDLLLRIMDGLAAGRPILFDERAQGFVTGDVTFGDLWKQPAWAAALAQLAVFGVWYALSQGRRFGRIVPLDRTTPRSTLEYVDAMANLYRRAGLHRPALAAQWRSFRVGVARRYGIEARASQSELRERLLTAVPDLDERILRDALVTAREEVRARRALSDRELVRAARTIDRLQKEVL